MPEYKVRVSFQGYVRGHSIVTVEADSEEEALDKAHYIDESTIDIVRNDTEITDKEIE